MEPPVYIVVQSAMPIEVFLRNLTFVEIKGNGKTSYSLQNHDSESPVLGRGWGGNGAMELLV